MRLSRRLLAAAAIVAPTALIIYGCGSDAGVGLMSPPGQDASVVPPVVGPDPDDGSSPLSDGSMTQNGDGASDGSLGNDGASTACKMNGATCGGSAECCTANCNAGSCAASVTTCKNPGVACTSPTECCTSSCIGLVADAGADGGIVGGQCADRVCTSDNAACATNAECCGGVCGTGDAGAKTCTPLNNSCKTSGNACAASGDCCSQLCSAGLCVGQVSFCTQLGDVCSANEQCCTGVCTKGAGATLGTCATLSVPGVPSSCSVAGQSCGMAGCTSTCCSRSCGSSFVANFTVCQPPSGCRPTGELCRGDGDCCGSQYNPDPIRGDRNVRCQKANASDPYGRCGQGNGCRANGAVCKVPTVTTMCQASAENSCCSGTVQEMNPSTYHFCQQDLLGIPRCTGAPDCSTQTNPALFAGRTCNSSVDCCNFFPCVPRSADPTQGFVCASAQCVATTGYCTTNGDCCRGNYCDIAQGASAGQCKSTGGGTSTGDAGADGGATDGGATDGGDAGRDASTDGGGGGGGACALYGQGCAATPDCCNGVTCIGGRCITP